MFPAAVSQGNSAASWNMSERRCAATSTVPTVGASRPANRFRTVDLPQPEAPTMATNSPRRTARVMSATATVAAEPEPKVLPTEVSMAMAGAAGDGAAMWGYIG